MSLAGDFRVRLRSHPATYSVVLQRRKARVVPKPFCLGEIKCAITSQDWRRMAKCLLRNDYWCKGLGQTQPKSAAYQRFKEIKAERKRNLIEQM